MRGGRRAVVFVAAIAAALAAAAGAAAGTPGLDRYRVVKPGEVLVDRAARRRVLAGYGAAAARLLCESDLFRLPKLYPPARYVGAVTEYGPELSMESFALLVMETSADYLGTGNEAPARMAARNLVAWAEGGAMLEWENRHSNTYLTVDRALMPTIAAVSLVKERLSPAEEAKILGWLKRLVARHNGPRTCARCARDGERVLRDAVNMAWGALVGDDRYFRMGAAAYLAALGEAEPGGRLPLEMAKGPRALASASRAIAALVAIAEMAAVQGHDLYGRTVDGVWLHDVVGYFLDAVGRAQAGDDLAAEMPPGAPTGGRQRLGFLYPQPNARHRMAWVEAYLARFPAGPNGRRIKALIAHRLMVAKETLVDDLVGANATCLFGGPKPLD